MSKKNSNKTVLITGANGLLGQKTVNTFAEHFGVLATDIQSPPATSTTGAEYHSLNLTDFAALKKFLDDRAPDILVNCAAYTNVDGAESDRETAWNVNAMAVKKMCHILRRKKTKFIQISTDYIFDGQNGPYDEGARPDPLNYYGTSKLAAENAVKASGIDYLIVRTNVLYGAAPGVKNNFVLWVKTSLENHQKIRVVDDQVNNATLANGLAECLLMACVMNARGVYNYAGTDLINRYVFAQKIADYFGYDKSLISPCKTADLNQPAPRPLNSGLITDKVVNDLHIRLYDTRAGLKQVEKDLKQCEI